MAATTAAHPSRSSEMSDIATVGGLPSTVKLLIFDMDGVLWTGDHVIKGVPEAIAWLRSSGRKILFMTNNASKHRSQYVTKMSKLGYLNIDQSEIYTSAYATALYLKERGFAESGKKVFCATGDGFKAELAELGIEAVGGVEYARKLQGLTVAETAVLPLEEGVGAVVTGFNPDLNYGLISLAARYALEPETLLLATNDDRLTPQGPDKTMLPGGGVVMAAVEHAASRKAEVIGKPNRYMLKYMLDQHGKGVQSDGAALLETVLMVGDRLDTDVCFGARGGLQTMLVLSGCTSAEALAKHAESHQVAVDSEDGLPDDHLPLPTFFGASVASLVGEGKEGGEEEEEGQGKQ